MQAISIPRLRTIVFTNKKTGEKSKNIGLNEKNVIFLSGSNLVNVIIGKEDIKKYLFTKISYYEKQILNQKYVKK